MEDACEAIGAEYRGRKVGGFGQSAVFSFFPNKQMTTGEGAMIACRDAAIAARLRVLRNQGVGEGGTGLVHEELGYNYRMTELSAALGLSQLRRIEEMLEMREAVAGLYRERLQSVAGARLIEAAPAPSRLSWSRRSSGSIRFRPGRGHRRLSRAGIPPGPISSRFTSSLLPAQLRLFAGDFR